MSSLIIPTPCNDLRIGSEMLIYDNSCRITELTKAKTGKHGSAKAHFKGIDIFTDRKYEFHATTSDKIDVPEIIKNEYQLIDIDNETVSYLDNEGNIKDDLKMPDLCDSDNKLAIDLCNTFNNTKDADIFINVISFREVSAIKGFRVK